MRTTRIRTARRVTDLVGDLLLIAWGVLWLFIARSTRDLLDSIAQPMQRLGASTGTVADRLDETGQSLGDVPLVGEQLAAPFPGISASLRDLATQISTQVASLTATSGWVVPLVFLVPTLIAAGLYIAWRIRRVRESAAARGLLERNRSLELFALRGMSTVPLHRLRWLTVDPVAGWRAGDPAMIPRLADLEMRRVGIEFVDGTMTARTPTER